MNKWATQERFRQRRWERARDEVSRLLIPMLIDVFRLPNTIHLRKYPHDDAFAVFDEWVHLGDCVRPHGGRFYAYRPIVSLTLAARVRAKLLTFWLQMLRVLRIKK